MPIAVRETTPMMRLGGTAVLFVIALGLFVVASVTHVAWPLFVAWAPLIAVPWLLTRPEAGQQGPDASEPAESDATEASSETDQPPATAEAHDVQAGDAAESGDSDSN
jgi:hypothetical protein